MIIIKISGFFRNQIWLFVGHIDLVGEMSICRKRSTVQTQAASICCVHEKDT